jgi:Zn-dependent peptidase ImmA (M78 family)
MESISKKVQMLVKRYKTNCPFTLAKNLGILVVQEDLGKTLGYYNKHFKVKLIHINENTSEKQKIFICSHELGHAILHPDSNTPFLKKNTFYSTDRIEIDANTFAINLVFSKRDEHNTVMKKEAIEEYGVPLKLVRRLLEHNIKGE